MKKAQVEAYENYRNFANSCHMPPSILSFKRPNPNANCGYARILKAIATLPKKNRTSRAAINEALGLETYSMCYGGPAITGCNSYNRLVRAELIEKKNGIYQTTKLGKRYIKEMKLI